MSNLFDSLVRYGDVFSLNDTLDYPKFHEGLHKFDDKWVKYNPKKPIERYGFFRMIVNPLIIELM